MALFALSVLFSLWFHDDKHRLAAMLVFVLPPLLMLVGALRGSATAAFWAGVFGLFWFCHGVVVAYGRPAERGLRLGGNRVGDRDRRGLELAGRECALRQEERRGHHRIGRGAAPEAAASLLHNHAPTDIETAGVSAGWKNC